MKIVLTQYCGIKECFDLSNLSLFIDFIDSKIFCEKFHCPVSIECIVGMFTEREEFKLKRHPLHIIIRKYYLFKNYFHLACKCFVYKL